MNIFNDYKHIVNLYIKCNYMCEYLQFYQEMKENPFIHIF